MKARNHMSRQAWRMVFLLLLPVLCAGCSPRIVEKVRTEYEYRDVHHRDTVVTRDSVYIREWMKGDTIFIEKYKDRYVFRDRWRDSVQVREVHDTTAISVMVEYGFSQCKRKGVQENGCTIERTIHYGRMFTLQSEQALPGANRALAVRR